MKARHDVGRVAENEVVQREQTALDVREWREHQLIRTHLLYPSITAHAATRFSRVFSAQSPLVRFVVQQIDNKSTTSPQ